MAIKRKDEIEGFTILSSRVENRQRDQFSRGQGFCVSVAKNEDGTYTAASSDGQFEVKAATEERAAYGLQQAMLQSGLRGEL